MSPLKLNEGLAALEVWDEKAIVARAERMSILATEVWCAPILSEDLLSSYREGTVATTVYSLADHPQIVAGAPMSQLFEHIRKEILALDPCVSEEFLKFYIAYKAETNFVDIYPQMSRLRLTINLQFHEIVDTRGLCHDITGYRLNGSVQVGLETVADIPYIMGFVRQAFEKQMGNGESNT